MGFFRKAGAQYASDWQHGIARPAESSGGTTRRKKALPKQGFH
jgi:hypothetical protein